MELTINGVRHQVDAEPERILLSVLRDELDLAGSKYGCGEGPCGACTVLIAGLPARACQTRAEVGVASSGRPGTGREIRVLRLTEAFECGAIVNPDHLQAQVEGAMIMGLGGALFEAIDFAGGKILNPHLARYRVPCFRDVPPHIDVVLVDRKDLPSAGAGETPIATVAPALASAIHMATGEWRRSLPMLAGPAANATQNGGAAF